MNTPSPSAVEAARKIQDEIKSCRRRTGCVDVIPGTNELGAIIDEMNPRIATTYTKSYVSASFGTEDSPLELVTMKSGLDEIAVIPASLLREMIDELRPILDSENDQGRATQPEEKR